MVFQSAADDLVADDDNDKIDIFVHDRKKGTTTRVSVSSAGDEAGEDCIGATVSASGRYVVFESLAADLVEGDLSGFSDVFLRDVKLGTTVRLSVDEAGTEGDAHSGAGMISAKGRHVAFESTASNLVELRRVSVDSSGTEVDGPSADGAVSNNGRYVAFQSDSADLVDDDDNADTDVFLKDMK